MNQPFSHSVEIVSWNVITGLIIDREEDSNNHDVRQTCCSSWLVDDLRCLGYNVFLDVVRCMYTHTPHSTTTNTNTVVRLVCEMWWTLKLLYTAIHFGHCSFFQFRTLPSSVGPSVVRQGSQWTLLGPHYTSGLQIKDIETTQSKTRTS